MSGGLLRRFRRRGVFALALGGLVLMTATAPFASGRQAHNNGRAATGIFKLDHLIFIVQENRSFDHYFGTYESPSGEPVNGIPRKPNGHFAVCVPHPVLQKCVPPYHSTSPVNLGGPHSHTAAIGDINNGKMNGFIREAQNNPRQAACIAKPFSSKCVGIVGPRGQPDVMSFHTGAEIPNYWAYADWGVLQDNMFQPVDSWSLPSHLYLVSAWAASCSDPNDAMTCHSDPELSKAFSYPWEDITDLLNNAGITWSYYVADGTNTTCTGLPCDQDRITATPRGWDPLPWFKTVKDNGQVGNIQTLSQFYSDAANGTLPQVSWVIPGGNVSEHPGHGSLEPGHEYVKTLINAIGEGPEWDSTAAFLTWDDWGGFYDHVKPRKIDNMGYGLRVPGLVISPYAKQAYVDHQELSFDAYLKFVEDRFLSGARIDPATDLVPDPRPTVREDVPTLGDVSSDFDFNQSPRPAPIL